MKHIIAYARDNWFTKRLPVHDLDTHIRAGADWLLHAWKQSGDHGVPHSYDIRQQAWLPSYPETTGYIIPTLYDVASIYGVREYAEAATLMALWESDEQLEDGGVRAGHMGAEVVVPTIFNTGQVLFGWARCVAETDNERCRESLKKAADWLVDAMDDDGGWTKYGSPFAPGAVKLYNVRCAFGLVQAYAVLQDERYIQAARANVNWVLSKADSNGWLPKNCLTDNPDALTHTIAYAMRGIVEVGYAVDDQSFVDFGIQMAEKMVLLQRENGSFPARVKNDWSSDYRWSCLTGNSQLSLNFFRLFEITGKKHFIEPAKRANRYNMSLQNCATSDLNIRGAIKGSHPINGGYMTYRYPNWATKFFIDALIKEKSYVKSDQ